MKKYIACALALSSFLSLSSNSAHAAGADGTRGGGEVVSYNGFLRLRDLVDPSVCQYKTGIELREANSKLDEVLSRVARLDWYFAAGLKYEIDQLQVCFTKGLVKIPGDDWDSVIRYRPHHRRQVAIRFLGSYDVYMDKDMYADLSERDRAFLLIHEALHSFIPWNVYDRLEGLRSAVSTIAQIDEGKITSAIQLHSDLDHDSVEYPWSAEDLSGSRTAIEFALSFPEDQAKIVLSLPDLNSLFDLKNLCAQSELLYPSHRALLTQTPADEALSLLLGVQNPIPVLDRLLGTDSSKITMFDPLLVGFSAARSIHESSFSAHLLASDAIKRGPRLFTEMSQKDLVIDRMRIQGTHGFDLLGIPDRSEAQVAGEIPALAVAPDTVAKVQDLSPEIRGLIDMIDWALTQNNDRGDQFLANSITQNNAFYEAFGVTKLESKLQTLEAPVAREKTDVADELTELVRGFRIVLIDQVTQQAGADAAAKLDRQIDWARLGLNLKKGN